MDDPGNFKDRAFWADQEQVGSEQEEITALLHGILLKSLEKEEAQCAALHEAMLELFEE